MRELLILVIHLIVTFAKLLRPGGARAVAAESLLLKHQLLISNRPRQRAPNLTALDRFVLGLSLANCYFRLLLAAEIVRGNVAANRTDSVLGEL